MRLDWYDRRIVEFVIECGPHPRPTDAQTHACFGISAQRVMRRLDAVINLVDNPGLALGETDRDLLQRVRALRV